MAFLAGDDIIQEDTDLVSQALVIFLVSFLEDHVEGNLQAWNTFWVDSQGFDCRFATHLNKIPKSFNSKRDNIGSEILSLTYDSYKLSSNSKRYKAISDGLEKTDCRDGL